MSGFSTVGWQWAGGTAQKLSVQKASVRGKRKPHSRKGDDSGENACMLRLYLKKFLPEKWRGGTKHY